jgi:DNA replication protein DnaC
MTEPAGADEPPLYDVSTREGFLRRATEMTDRRIPPRFLKAAASHPDVAAWCEDFGPSSSSLLILGPTGTGKSHQAFGAIRTIAAKGVTPGWHAATAPSLFAALRPREGTDSDGEYRKIAAVPLLLLDDLGAAKGSEWTEEILYRLINDRYEAMLPGLFTSNLLPGQLRSVLGDRVASRLAEMCQQVALRGPDRRRTT